MDGNISGFLGMSSRGDGVGQSSDFSGNLRQRKINRHKAYYKQTTGDDIDPETGEVLNFKPSNNYQNPYRKKTMAYAKRSYGGFNANSALNKLPNPSTLLNFGFMALIGFTGYKLYKKFIAPMVSTDPNDVVQRDNDKAIASASSNPKADKSKSIGATEQTLKQAGLQKTNTHVNFALNIYNLMNKLNMDEAAVIKTVKSWSVQTAQLVKVAYGVKPLPDRYGIFSFGIFSKDMTLPETLREVLNDSEQKQISSWLTAMDKA